MTKAEAEKLGDELWDLVKQGPGRNEVGLARVSEIERAFCYDPQSTPYIREKVRSAAGWFGYWFTPRQWEPWGEEKMRGILNNDIGRLRMGIISEWPDPDEQLAE